MDEAIKYKVNNRPKPGSLLLLGLQWFAVVMPFLIILASLVSEVYPSGSAANTIYLQKMFLVSGAATILQLFFGHRLPIINGPATVLLIGLVSNSNVSPEASYTAIAAGGALIALFSLVGAFKYLRHVFTPRVIVVILMLVAVTISPLIVRLAAGKHHPVFANMMFAAVLAMGMIAVNTRARGLLKSTVILLGLVAGSLLYFGLFGIENIAPRTGFDWQTFRETLVISPQFEPGTLLAFFFCYLALAVNEFGAVEATGRFLGIETLSRPTQRGVRVTGLVNLAAGLTGVIGNVDYSLSPGVIATTRSASRYPLIVMGILLIVCALAPGSLALFRYIPDVVTGGVLLYIMGSQLSSGIQLMAADKTVPDFGTAMIVGFPVILSILISFAPASFSESMPSLLRPVLPNGFVMGTIAVLILEHVIHGKMKTKK